MKLSRYTIMVTAVALLLALTAAGAMAQRTKVEVWLLGDETTGSYGKVWQIIKQEIEKDLPHIEVDMHFGASPDTRYTVAYAAGIGPDVVTLSTRMSAQFIKQGMVSPINYDKFGVKDAEGLKDLFYPGSLNTMYAIDDIYMMPVELTTFGMYYNPEMMEEAGIAASDVPSTWDEIIATGKKFMKQNPDTQAYDQVGLALNTGWLWASFRWMALLRQYGTEWIEDGVVKLDSPEAMEAMEMLSSLFHDEQVTTTTTGQAAFVNRRAPFYLAPSYENNATDLPAKVNFEYGSAPYPAKDLDNRVSTSYAWGLYVNSQSQVKDEAWEVINYLTSERWAPVWFETSALLIPRAGDWIMDVIANQPQLAPFIMELEVAQVEILHEQYQPIQSAIVAAENQIIQRTDSVQNIMTSLNRQVQAYVDEVQNGN